METKTLVTLVLGAQWGDEGKGKIVDFLGEGADVVARYQGGANAGHTIIRNGEKFILHLLPAGILRPGTVCIIGTGVVVDPVALMDEIKQVESAGISLKDRLFVSHQAHLIMPYHKLLDQISEQRTDRKKIGTTGRGIGPAYVDKFSRVGIRIVDLLDRECLREKIRANVEDKNRIFSKIYETKELNVDDIVEEYIEFDRKSIPTSRMFPSCWMRQFAAARKSSSLKERRVLCSTSTWELIPLSRRPIPPPAEPAPGIRHWPQKNR